MAGADERDARTGADSASDAPDMGGTVAMNPADLPDAAGENPSAPEDDATRVVPAHEAATSVAARIPEIDAAPDGQTVAMPDVAMPEQDGIDALSDPYAAVPDPEDLTTAHPVVAIPSPVESLPERRRRFPRWAIVLIVIAVLAAAAGVAYLTYENELWGGKTIPEVVGLTEEEAREELEGLGFAVEVEYRATDEGFGTVLSCSPSEGERIDLSTSVTLVVAGERTIPNVVGLSEEAATAALYEAGAANVLIKRTNSEEEPGTVLSVDPEEGSPFVSEDEITLTVAQAYTVPSLDGLSVDEALARLEDEGLAGSVTYVESDAEKNTVVSTDPEAGTEVSAGATIELSVSSPYPTSVTSFLEYFDTDPSDLAAFLSDEGFTLRYGAIITHNGNAHVVYVNESGDVLHITDNPETGRYDGETTGDVLASGAGVGGVRYAFSADSLPEGASVESEDGVRAIMEECGFEGLVDSCTQEDIAAPEELPEDAHFICAYGQQGDYAWVVRIGGYGDVSGVVALVAPTSHFSGLDLSDYGGSICDYVAYVDLFAE